MKHLFSIIVALALYFTPGQLFAASVGQTGGQAAQQTASQTLSQTPSRVGSLHSSTWLPEHYSREQRNIHLETVLSFVEHFAYLNKLQGAALPPLLLEKSPVSATASDGINDLEGLNRAATSLIGREDLDLILVSGPEALQALRQALSKNSAASTSSPNPANPANSSSLPGRRPLLLALTPDCLPPDQSQPGQGQAGQGQTGKTGVKAAGQTGGLIALAPGFWKQRLVDYAGAVRFRRLGLIAPPPGSAPVNKAVAGALAAEAEKLDAAGRFELFYYEALADNSQAQCREAVDYLFFDEIDALVLDGYGCFAPGRPDFAELLDLLQQRGIFPLSLNESGLAGQGALLAPAPGQGERLGRALAAQVFAALTQNGQPGDFSQLPARLEAFSAFGLSEFSIDLNVARNMGFDPPAALTAISRPASAPQTVPQAVPPTVPQTAE